MVSYGKSASKMMNDVRYAEVEQRDSIDYEDDHVRQAIVHAREDICGMSFFLLTVNNQLRTVRWLLSAIVVLLVVVAVELA